LYNLMLKKGWTLGSEPLTRFMQRIIEWRRPAAVKLLERFWRGRKTDLAVSLVPNLNRAVRESLGAARPQTPYVTILTDIADHPPHFWIERQRQYLVCGSAKAVEQARALGHEERRIFRTSGMILSPRFYEPVNVDRDAELRRLGFDPAEPTGLVLFGGQGSKVMLEIARTLDNVQLILICGKNEKLEAALRGRRRSKPAFVEGFTREIPYYMHLAGFFIGKPGPGSISEALRMKLPVIVERNAWTLTQERYNAEWILENDVGLVLPNFRRVDEAVRELLRPETYARFRARAEAMDNRAVFEIPDMLEQIMGKSQEPEARSQP
ncbi:MAG: glycosyltransferase, partial [Bryobacteraceae bacterium]